MSSPWEHDIKVFIDSDKLPPKFRLESDLDKGSKDGDFEFNNKGKPGFVLNYIIQSDGVGKDYYFPTDLDEALYSAKGTTCPKKKGQWEQFQATQVKSGNKILVVRNLNQEGFEGHFAYTLRVTKTPNQTDPKFLDLDPGGLNNNGQVRSSDSFVTYAAITVATVALVVAITETFHITNFFR
jgi:hypothetical protein